MREPTTDHGRRTTDTGEARLVYLLREASEPDPYEAAFAGAGFRVRSIPVLQFTFGSQEALREALSHPGTYSGMILTSPRAVEALAEALVWLPHQQPAWHAKPVFAVGPRTAEALREIGFSPEGAESGSGELLAAHIRTQAADYEAPLLFLCGSRRREVLPETLAGAGIPLEELCVYETALRPESALPQEPHPAWVVFFSPSGVEATCRNGRLPWEAARCAAIGPTTAAALEQAGRSPDAVAAEPTPEGLLKAIVGAEG